MDFEVVKTEAQEFDRWVTGLVDLIPTQVYVSFFNEYLWCLSKFHLFNLKGIQNVMTLKVEIWERQPQT